MRSLCGHIIVQRQLEISKIKIHSAKLKKPPTGLPMGHKSMKNYINWIANYITEDLYDFNEGIRHVYKKKESETPSDFQYYFDLDDTLANTEAALKFLDKTLETKGRKFEKDILGRATGDNVVEVERDSKYEKADILKRYAYNSLDKNKAYSPEEKSEIFCNNIKLNLSNIKAHKDINILWNRAHQLSGKAPKIRVEIPGDSWYGISQSTIEPTNLKQAFIDGSIEWCNKNLSPAPSRNDIIFVSGSQNAMPDISKSVLISSNYNNVDAWQDAGGRAVLHTNTRSTLEGIDTAAGELDFEIDLKGDEGSDTKPLNKGQKASENLKIYEYEYNHTKYKMGRASVPVSNGDRMTVFYINEYGGNDKELMGWFKEKKTKNLNGLGSDVSNYLDDRVNIMATFLEQRGWLDSIRYIHIPESSSAIAKTIADRLRNGIYKTESDKNFYYDSTEEEDDLYGDEDYDQYMQQVLDAETKRRNDNRNQYEQPEEKTARPKAITVIRWSKITDPNYYQKWFQNLYNTEKDVKRWVDSDPTVYKSCMTQLVKYANGQLKSKQLYRNLRFHFTDFLMPNNLPDRIQKGRHLIIDDSLTYGGTTKSIARYLGRERGLRNSEDSNMIGFTLYKNI